jgi:hypothetical protein
MILTIYQDHFLWLILMVKFGDVLLYMTTLFIWMIWRELPLIIMSVSMIIILSLIFNSILKLEITYLIKNRNWS